MVISISFIKQVTTVGTVAWGVVSVGTGSAVVGEEAMWPELFSSAVDFSVVGGPVGWVLVSGVLWLVPTEAEDSSGGVVDRGEGEVAGAGGEVSAGSPEVNCELVAGMLVSGVPGLCSTGVCVIRTPLLVGEWSVFVTV